MVHMHQTGVDIQPGEGCLAMSNLAHRMETDHQALASSKSGWNLAITYHVSTNKIWCVLLWGTMDVMQVVGTSKFLNSSQGYGALHLWAIHQHIFFDIKAPPVTTFYGWQINCSWYWVLILTLVSYLLILRKEKKRTCGELKCLCLGGVLALSKIFRPGQWHTYVQPSSILILCSSKCYWILLFTSTAPQTWDRRGACALKSKYKMRK